MKARTQSTSSFDSGKKRQKSDFNSGGSSFGGGFKSKSNSFGKSRGFSGPKSGGFNKPAGFNQDKPSFSASREDFLSDRPSSFGGNRDQGSKPSYASDRPSFQRSSSDRSSNSDRPSFGGGNSFGDRKPKSYGFGGGNRGGGSSFGGGNRGGGSSFGGGNRGGGSSYGGRGGNSGYRSKTRAFEGTALNDNMFIKKASAKPAEETNAKLTPISTLKVAQVLKANIAAKGFENLMPVQALAIPAVMEGLDVVAQANTGTGKTAAFVIPLLQKILDKEPVNCLVLVPTRELAEQIGQEIFSLAKDMKVFYAIVIGGANIHYQIQNIRKGVQFVVGTPGRINDLIERNVIRPETFNTLVLDEVDRMLDMGFVDEIQDIIKRIPENRQSLFFSATTNKRVTALMKNILKPDHISIDVSVGDTSEYINQDVVRYKTLADKVDLLSDLLLKYKNEKVLVFANTKREVDRLEQDLDNQNFSVETIHGDKRQTMRKRALTNFKSGKANVLIATDVAARGIDVSGVALVVNYDKPKNQEDYVHRIGRTGRAGLFGQALTFVKGY